MPPLPDVGPVSRDLTKSNRSFIVPNASASGSTKCPYSEYKAFGHPSEKFGMPGDIYLNIKPGYHELYARYPEGWKKWPGPDNVESTLIHPEYPDRYLWLKGDMSTFGWYPKKSLLTLSKNLTISELLSLVLKERVRLGMAPESNATRKRKKQGNEDIPRVSYAAKKSREIGTSAHELPNAIPPGPLAYQAPVSMSYPVTLSLQAHMHTSSDTADSIGVFPYSSQHQSPNSGLTWPDPTPLTPQDCHPHHSANSSHLPSVTVPIDPTALIGPSTLLQLQEHYMERAQSTTHPMQSGPSKVYALGGGNTVTSNFDTRLPVPGAGEVTSQIILPHTGNVAAFQEISRLKQENRLLRERLSNYNPPPSGILDRGGSRSLLATSTAPPRPTAPPSRDDNFDISEPHMPTPGPEVVPITGTNHEQNPVDIIVMSQHGTSGHDVSMFASSSRSEKRSSTEIMRTNSPLTEETAIGGSSGDVRHLLENQKGPNMGVSISNEKDRKPIEPTEVPRRLNRSHFAIIFYACASDMLCRLCLQRSPREFFHAKTSSTFYYLQDHCEKEHPTICDYLAAQTDRQLLELNCRLNVSAT